MNFWGTMENQASLGIGYVYKDIIIYYICTLGTSTTGLARTVFATTMTPCFELSLMLE